MRLRAAKGRPCNDSAGAARRVPSPGSAAGLRWPRIYNRTFCPPMLRFGCVRFPGFSTSFLKQRRRRSHLCDARRRHQRLAESTSDTQLHACWESVEGKGAGKEGGGVGVGVLGIERPGGLLTPGRHEAQVRAEHDVNG